MAQGNGEDKKGMQYFNLMEIIFPYPYNYFSVLLCIIT